MFVPLLLLSTVFAVGTYGQTFSSVNPQWTWIGGVASPYYGYFPSAPSTTDIAYPTSYYPGSKKDVATWIGSDGASIYLFGGYGYAGYYLGVTQDFWRFNITSGKWAWLGGASIPYTTAPVFFSAMNTASTTPPSGRYAPLTWSAGDKLYLYGGETSYPVIANFADMYVYSISSNSWMWIAGTSTLNFNGSLSGPGARLRSATWLDKNNNLNLFGGTGWVNGASTVMNDLWSFSTSTTSWTYVSGPYNITMTPRYGVFGTIGQSNSSNIPGARTGSIAWYNIGSDTVYIFGGSGFQSSSGLSVSNYLNDLWSYTSSSGWIWLGGASASSTAYSTYGTTLVESNTTQPGLRTTPYAWMDQNIFYLFGGNGCGTSTYGCSSSLNDIDVFNPSTSLWTWIGGTTYPQTVTYSTMNVAGVSHPGGRYQGSCFTINGKKYLFGGIIYGGTIPYGGNDVWRLDICPTTAYQINFTTCVTCSSGQYWRQSSSSCVNCTAGKYTTSTNMMCAQCAGGYISADMASSCTMCPTGYWSDSSNTACSSCAPGYFADANSGGNCTQCSTGRYATAGTQTSCSKCSAGKFAYKNGTGSCVSCTPGWYSDSDGSTYCTKCAAGKYMKNYGATACVSCDSGYRSNVQGASSCSVVLQSLSTDGTTTTNTGYAVLAIFALVPISVFVLWKVGAFSRTRRPAKSPENKEETAL